LVFITSILRILAATQFLIINYILVDYLVGYGINAMISELMITPKPKQLKSIYFNGNGAKKLPWRPRPVYFSPSVSL